LIPEAFGLTEEVRSSVTALAPVAWEQLAVTIEVAAPTVGEDEDCAIVEAFGEMLNILTSVGLPDV
jgi:hypothetical protein